jgi:CheY-like chemotaxis protein
MLKPGPFRSEFSFFRSGTLQLYPDIYILVLITAMKKIILAKDIQRNLEEERSFLGRTDIITFTSSSNEQILKLHRSEKADLIVTELDSPGMSGEILCSLIRNDKELSNVSIIIICSDSASHHERCLTCVANAFISKPVNNAALLQEMHQLLHIAPRRSCRVPVGIKLDGTSRKMPFTARAENFSASGMLLLTSAKLSEGDTISCTFSLPGFGQVTAGADIVRMLEKGTKKETNLYGVKFIELSDEAASAIEAFLKKASPHI